MTPLDRLSGDKVTTFSTAYALEIDGCFFVLITHSPREGSYVFTCLERFEAILCRAFNLLINWSCGKIVPGATIFSFLFPIENSASDPHLISDDLMLFVSTVA